MTAKPCSKCKITKPLEDYHRSSRARDGRQAKCKACASAQARERYLSLPRERIDEVSRAWREANPERALAARQAYEAANRERMAEVRRTWREVNAERVRELNRAWSEANRERHAATTRAWALANPDRRRSMVQNRQARLAAALVEDVDRAVVWARDGGLCRLCGEPADPAAWDLEHLTPLSRGGEHSYANTAVSHPWCNGSKGTRTLEEWEAARAVACPGG